MDNLMQLKSIIEQSNNIVFFGGAGVSTESGLPDFRSTDGLYHQQYKYPPETMLSHSFFIQHTEEFYQFYKDKMLFLDAKPNSAHYALAKLEGQGKLKAVITQNIDGLHQLAGSRKVLELHGSVHRNYCTVCNKPYGIDEIYNTKGIPRCTCGNLIKPDVVLYEEGLNDLILRESIDLISKADVLIVGGTSLVVYPAAGLIDYYQGSKLILINKSTTKMDNRANLIIDGKIGEVLSFVE